MFLTSLYARLITFQNEKGATAVEYGIMVALIAVAVIITVGAIGIRLNGVFTTVQNALPAGP